jgi:hypothetical protein
MAKICKLKDGATFTTLATPEGLNDLELRIGPTGANKGGDIFVKESVAGNGDVTYRWQRFEPPAK